MADMGFSEQLALSASVDDLRVVVAARIRSHRDLDGLVLVGGPELTACQIGLATVQGVKRLLSKEYFSNLFYFSLGLAVR